MITEEMVEAAASAIEEVYLDAAGAVSAARAALEAIEPMVRDLIEKRIAQAFVAGAEYGHERGRAAERAIQKW